MQEHPVLFDTGLYFGYYWRQSRECGFWFSELKSVSDYSSLNPASGGMMILRRKYSRRSHSLAKSIMARSLKKGPYVDAKLLKKIEGKKSDKVGVIKTWARRSQISPEMVGFTFGVHNGKDHIEVFVTEEMVGHCLGEFAQTKKFIRHGGKMQKELEQKKKEAEIAAAKAAKTAAAK